MAVCEPARPLLVLVPRPRLPRLLLVEGEEEGRPRIYLGWKVKTLWCVGWLGLGDELWAGRREGEGRRGPAI